MPVMVDEHAYKNPPGNWGESLHSGTDYANFLKINLLRSRL